MRSTRRADSLAFKGRSGWSVKLFNNCAGMLRQSKCLTDLKTFSKSQNYDTRNLLSCLALNGENIRSIVHQKDKLFTVLDYARNFGKATKEGLTRGTNWAACYFSNSNSWCPLLECAMILSAIPVI